MPFSKREAAPVLRYYMFYHSKYNVLYAALNYLKPMFLFTSFAVTASSQAFLCNPKPAFVYMVVGVWAMSAIIYMFFQEYEAEKYDLSLDFIIYHNISEGTIEIKNIYRILAAIYITITYALNFKGIYCTFYPNSIQSQNFLVHESFQFAMYVGNVCLYALFLTWLYDLYNKILRDNNTKDKLIRWLKPEFFILDNKVRLNWINKEIKFNFNEIKKLKIIIIELVVCIPVIISLILVCCMKPDYYLKGGKLILVATLHTAAMLVISIFFENLNNLRRVFNLNSNRYWYDIIIMLLTLFIIIMFTIPFYNDICDYFFSSYTNWRNKPQRGVIMIN